MIATGNIKIIAEDINFLSANFEQFSLFNGYYNDHRNIHDWFSLSGDFDSLVKIIISQQISMKVADKLFGKLQACFDNEITPNRLSNSNIDIIRSCGISNAKIACILSLAKSLQSNEINITKLSQDDDQSVRNILTSIKGIGTWTADMYLLFALKRTNIFPATDLGVKIGVGRCQYSCRIFVKKI